MLQSSPSLSGIHHITAIAEDPQRNLDFYSGLLGLRLVKRTVNFDDPGTYHFYYGDETGRPGTLLTFFPWPGAPRGRRGAGQATAIAFAIPHDSLGFWAGRLKRNGIATSDAAPRFGEEAVAFQDPDGLGLELVSSAEGNAGEGVARGPVPAERAIRGLHGVTLSEEGCERTSGLLVGTLGFRREQEQGSRFRYRASGAGPGLVVDLLFVPDAPRGVVAAGTVHHVAFRAADDAEQGKWRDRLARAGLNVTPVLDRQYFRSIYFREPGGVLFEIATDPPGFTVNEPVESLGARLMLPPWLEPRREVLERSLPPLAPPRPAL
jgi:glyoxalase family protein